MQEAINKNNDDSLRGMLLPESLKELDLCGIGLKIAIIGNEAYVALRPVVEALSMDWSAQYRRILRDSALSQHIHAIIMPGADGKNHAMMCLRLKYFPGWLFGITPDRARSELSPILARYREKCFHSLWQTFQADLDVLEQKLYTWLQDLQTFKEKTPHPRPPHALYQYLKEKVRTQCSRARNMSLPATLTIEEWLFALEHFNGLCAYCQARPGIIIEHFIPLNSGGGTTRDNCIPACHSCNAKKSNRHPDSVVTLSSVMLKRIHSYFSLACT